MHRLLLLVLLALSACGEEISSEDTTATDSTEGPEIVIINDTTPASDMSEDFTSEEDYSDSEVFSEETGTAGVEGLAERMASHAINLVYIEKPLRLSTQVLGESTASDGRRELKVQYRWYDRWSSRPYEMKGRLRVNTDGSDADFKVLSRNTELEAYGMVEDKQGSQKHVEQI